MSSLADVAKGGDGAKSAPIFSREYLQRCSFIELNARERAKSLFDPGTGRELAEPFDRIESPWLASQGVTPQADDGCIVMRGTIGGNKATVIAFNGSFQGGGIGEVSGAKLTATLDLACRDNEKGSQTSAVLLVERCLALVLRSFSEGRMRGRPVGVRDQQLEKRRKNNEQIHWSPRTGMVQGAYRSSIVNAGRSTFRVNR